MHKPEKYLPLLACLGSLALISGLTFQNSGQSAQLTLKFVGLIERAHFRLTGSLIAEYPLYHLLRKLAHTAEYFLLGASAGYFFSRRQKHFVGPALVLSASWSLLDQSSKLLVPGREFDPTDFPFDIAGYVLGISFILLAQRLYARKS
ncbi:hypothetical protein lacNasYZ03_06970 [Lactobacillus nasalidis]|uniref:VanZ-like domain-containing protein n=1 Tax=Lactobacillus nasalidis TaxID=2797258 RepID=A0ABQ3W3K7_9LACO|nr:VanZ family protein [Lactobacillus nasalidis]GHV97230.1 hypothetical protein lacNasYZ01_04120 [Lactobacillus nasalidis]GHV99984.1 hypothetical protein lacNasYZ02_14140 [Lactobacillus nasalidis]GHW01010.1 hypothetical protein lacNasYZ03_06970 [Lactobacillus nasalidis]